MTLAPLFARPLLATEHTEFDIGAERVAFALARHCALPLAVVLPMAGNPEFDVAAPELAERADAAAADKVRALRALGAQSGVAVDVQVRRGVELHNEIIDEALQRGSDLIVIRRRGRRGLLANLLVGEMVGQVVAHAPCSVLVNARGAQFWTRRVLAAVDPLAPDLATVGRAASIAAACALPLTLLGVIADADEQRAEAARRGIDAALAVARARTPLVDHVTVVGAPPEAIVGGATRSGADLIVLGRQGSGRAARRRIGSVAHKVLGLSECPVLVCIGAATAETP